MSVLGWITASGLLMSAIALVGSTTLLLSSRMLERVLLPLVAFAAGSLIGGAFFHMIPASLTVIGSSPDVVLLIVAGFTVFFMLELLLHWRHCHRAAIGRAEARQPLTYLILIGDGLHNFLGGLAIGAMFLIDVRLGLMAWLAAAAHEVPQELGDFAVLLHGGWEPRRALLFNLLSGLTFLAGGLTTYVAAQSVNVAWLIPFAAGNFLYIGASDLVPEVNRQKSGVEGLICLAAFLSGLAILYAARAIA